VEWETAKKWGVYPEGAAVNKGEPLFPRIDVKKELEELEKLTLAAAEIRKSNHRSRKRRKRMRKRMNISP